MTNQHTYNGNDIFKPFNAGLYGIDNDSDRSFQFEESKESILNAFRSEFKQPIIDALAQAGITFVRLQYFSPREYNFMTDSIDLVVEYTDDALYRAACEKHRERITKDLKENVSRDGYWARTADTFDEAVTNGDITTIAAILSGIDFPEWDWLYEHCVYEYACETCELIHGDVAEYGDDEDKTTVAKCRLAYLRAEIEAERISTSEILELQELAQYIDPSDTLLLEWAGVPEDGDIKHCAKHSAFMPDCLACNDKQ